MEDLLTRLCRIYQDDFGLTCTETVRQSIRDLLASGVEYEMISAAMDKAACMPMPSWRKARALISKWLQCGQFAP